MIVNLHAAKISSIIVTPPQAPALPLTEPAILRAANAFTLPETHVNDLAAQIHLQALRTALCIDSAFVVLFDRNHRKIDRLIAPRLQCVVNDPHVMADLILPSSELFVQRFAKQQVVAIDDVNGCHGELELLKSCLNHSGLKSLLVSGVVVRDAVLGLFVMGTSRRCAQWQFEMHLTLRLMATTYAAGLERHLDRRIYHGVKVW